MVNDAEWINVAGSRGLAVNTQQVDFLRGSEWFLKWVSGEKNYITHENVLLSELNQIKKFLGSNGFIMMHSIF